MASSSILQLPNAIPVVALQSGLTYSKELQKPGCMSNRLRVFPGPGAVKTVVKPGGDADARLVGVPIAPRYTDEVDERTKKPVNGRFAGHRVPYFSVERATGRQLEQALAEERAVEGQSSLPATLLALEARLRSAHVLQAPCEQRPHRPPAVLLAPSGCVVVRSTGSCRCCHISVRAS